MVRVLKVLMMMIVLYCRLKKAQSLGTSSGMERYYVIFSDLICADMAVSVGNYAWLRAFRYNEICPSSG
jgi:hypothetical protein